MSEQSEEQWLEQTGEDGVVVAQLNRAPANALTVEFLLEIETHFKRLDAEKTVRAVVLKGYEKVFSAGMDLKMLATLDEAGQTDVVDALNRTYGAIYGFSKPLVAAVTGHAIAGGLFFLLASDYRVGCDGAAQFGLSEVRVGVAFPVAALEIARAELSAAAARRILLGGHPVDVNEALGCGILDELVVQQAVDARAIEKARSLAASPVSAYAQIKQQLRAEALNKIDRALNHGGEPLRSGWFSPETTRAALEVLSRKR